MRILLVDDHEIVRQGIRALVETVEDFEVVGEAGTVEEAVKRVGLDSPEVVVLDVRLPDGSGVEACRDIRSRFPDVKVLMLTSFADEEALMSAIMAGASGFVLKKVNSTDLLGAIRRVGEGESLLDTTMTEQLFRRLRDGKSEDPVLSRLTDRERSILDLVAEGKTNRQIAEEMFLAEKTVKNYVSNLLSKMGMSRRTEAATYLTKQQTRSTDAQEWPDGVDPATT
ncbi:MAG: response regulator transcription factor [Acidimicrobiia bacterium]|nr:response regulator transcription factor [Acidimicrobiia bacterium]